MYIIETIYTLAAIIALAACFPQIRQIILTKRSEEFSAQTWLIWTFTQCMTLMYVIAIGNILMTVVNIAWVSFYAMMTYLIFRYRLAPPAEEMLTET